MQETVDVLLATYNGEKYIREQIESILNQTYKNIRLIISDDCSTNEEVREILKEYEQKDNRIQLYFQPQNLGYTKNFEFVLTKSTAGYIAFSDHDDIWYPNKIEESLKILKEKSSNKAYTINNKSYSYKQLYKFVCNIYHFLLKENKEKKPVVVYGHKEIYMKATFIACSFAGMTYVPIDNSMPKERVEKIIKQIDPLLIIGKNISKEKIYEIMNEDSYNEINDIYLKPDNIYYIIFTSGSTGVPKGVKITYKNLNSCINWLKNITKIRKGVVLNQANFSFDLSVADLYLSLISESEHYIINEILRVRF